MESSHSLTSTRNLSSLYGTASAGKFVDGDAVLKRKYINFLLPTGNGYAGFIIEGGLLNCAVDLLQGLYLSLLDVFTDKIDNDVRSKIISCLLKVDRGQWEVLLAQVCFIMPVGTRAHDVMWATEVLSSVTDSAHRERLTNVANRLFKWDTRTVERGYILSALATLDPEALAQIDEGDEGPRAEFVAKHVPASLKEGAKTVFVYDAILGQGWRV